SIPQIRDSFAANTHFAVRLRASWDVQDRLAGECRNLDLGPQRRLAEGNRHRTQEIAAVALEVGVLRDADDHLQIAGRRAGPALPSAPGGARAPPCSPSPRKVRRMPVSTPAGTLTSTVRSTCRRPLPRHFGHGSATSDPSPRQLGHSRCIEKKSPARPTTTAPRPPQRRQLVRFPVLEPTPRQSSHCSERSNVTFFLTP